MPVPRCVPASPPKRQSRLPCVRCSSRKNADGFLRSVQPTHGKSAWPKVLPRSCASRMRAAMSDLDLDELRDELSDFAQPEKKVRSEEHTSELQSLMRTSYAVFCWKKKKNT